MKKQDLALIMGKNIRLRRRAQNITQAELGQDAEVTGATISNIERGNFRPVMATIDSIAKILGVSIQVLMRKTEVKIKRVEKSPPRPMPTDRGVRHGND